MEKDIQVLKEDKVQTRKKAWEEAKDPRRMRSLSLSAIADQT